jgi:gliding motility-associated-like protein
LKRKLLFSLFAGLLLTFAVEGQAPVANFSFLYANTNCNPVTVRFADQSANVSDPSTTWTWTFGTVTASPTTSAFQNPSVLFNSSGTFTVTLVVANVFGSSSISKPITINPTPIVNFKASDSVGCFPFPVQFNDLSSPGAGATVTNWQWDLGATFTNTKNPNWTYKNATQTDITLVVTNNFNCTGSLTKVKYINVSTGVVPNFNAISSASCKPPTSVSFTNNTTGPPTMSYTWNFDDGSNSFSASPPPHNYVTPGTYNIKLVARSTAGCTDSVVQPVVISSASVVTSMLVPDSACINTPVTFQSNSVPQPGSSIWIFGDGNSAAGNSATHSYAGLGNFNVTLINNYGTCTDSVNKQIKVLNPPVPNFIALTSTVACRPPLTVNFQSTSTGAGTYDWDFGDGTPHGTGPNPSHTYTTYGSFYVLMTASNALGCSNGVTKLQFVQIRAPEVKITNLPAYGCAPYTFTPVISDSVVDGIASYAWDFGNGNTATGLVPPPQVYGFGIYKVTLTITSNGGCTATDTGSVKVGSIKPTANFSAAPTTVCVGSTVNFTDLSTGGADQWLWDFGNGNFSSAQNTSYTYPAPGVYTVKLTAYNHGCFDVKTATNLITVNPPLSKFVYKVLCSNKTQYTFTDSSTGANSWEWDFGDGSPHFFGATPPPHNYPNIAKTDTVVLKVGSASGCFNTSSQTIDVLAKTDFFTSVPSACKNTTVFVTVVPNPKNFGFYYDFGDGYVSPFVGSQSWGHIYTTPGSYTIKVVAVDTAGCADSLSKPNLVKINGPFAGFIESDTMSCKPLSITFTDKTVPDGVNNITNWSWNFGDGQGSNLKNPTHAYNGQGIYSVSLKVTDAAGCSDSVFKGNRITISAIQASFDNLNPLSCPGATVHFHNSSILGFSPVYTWNFGNSNTYTGLGDPSQVYAGIGTYNVKLKVVDLFNCKDSVTKIVKIDTPVASFTISDTLVRCPPALIDFKFTGSYYDSLTWIYGNGDIDKQNKLAFTKIYNLPGDYFPTLIVQSPGGCIAKASHHILVQGPKVIPSLSPSGGCDTLTVFFNLITVGTIIEYRWDFGDNTMDTTTVPTNSHFYRAPANLTGVYLPTVTVQNDSNCSVTYPMSTVTVVGISSSFTTDKTVACANSTIQFTDKTKTNGTITNYYWDFGDGTIISGAFPNPSHQYLTGALYNVKMVVTTQFGCQDSSIQVIKIVDNPSIDIGGAISQCVPATLNYTGIILVPDTSAFAWSWNFDNGQTSTLQNPAAQLYPKAGHYIVNLTATNSTGCIDTATADVYIYPLPTVFAGADTIICLGQNIPLQATGAATYNWLPPTNGSLTCTACQNPVGTPLVTTQYYVQGTSSLGCVAIDTIVVTVNQPVTVTVSPDDSVCLGQSAQLVASGAALYVWSPAAGLSNTKIANPLASPSVTTIYQVIGSDNKYCFSDTGYINTTVFNYPILNVGPDATINVGSSYQVPGSGSADIVSLNWLPVTALSCTNCLSPLATPKNTTVYALSATNNGGCTTVDSLKITVICNGANFFVPNTFSPNGDGTNDIFYVRGKGLNIIPSITIFNRWGQIVFQRKDFAPNDPSAGWDGTINGQKAPLDVYIYTMDIICDNSSLIPYHGNITLIR